MRRMLYTARRDAELQAQNGLYFATAFVLLVMLAGFAAVPTSGVARLLPVVALNTLAVTGFYFSAALVLLERAEGSATALLVTPLRPLEYLGARALTLAALGAIQVLALGLLLLGPGPQLLALVLGAALAAAILALAGYAAAAGHAPVSEFLPPSLPWLALLLAPMLFDMLEWRNPLLWLHPLYGSLALMRFAVAARPIWEPILGLALSLAWLVLIFRLAHHAYLHRQRPA